MYWDRINFIYFCLHLFPIPLKWRLLLAVCVRRPAISASLPQVLWFLKVTTIQNRLVITIVARTLSGECVSGCFRLMELWVQPVQPGYLAPWEPHSQIKFSHPKSTKNRNRRKMWTPQQGGPQSICASSLSVESLKTIEARVPVTGLYRQLRWQPGCLGTFTISKERPAALWKEGEGGDRAF